MALERHLVLFTRYPSYGTGKRRLAAGVGAAVALRFQRISLANTVRRLATDRRWRMWIAVTPDRSGPWPLQVEVIAQGGGDLGRRLGRVMHTLPAGPTLVIGSDIPGITRPLVAEAFRALDGHDAVIGPSNDGGYWAIGLRRAPRRIYPFDDVRWSTRHALADTIANLRGHSVARLAQLNDIDDVASLTGHPRWNLLVDQSHHGAFERPV
jgi:uncharacterized protein